jgi:ADP-heptose:LPS heptosyltransferase
MKLAPVLAVRPDGMGDVLLTGPAVRALAAGGREVSFLAGPAGTQAAAMLPGVTRVLTASVPWIDPEPAAFEPRQVSALVRALRRLCPAEAVIFTSFHQSALPMALALRMAGVRRVSAISEDYPGSLLDVRHRLTADIPEARRNLSLAGAAGFRLPPGDPGLLAVAGPRPDSRLLTGAGGYVVLHQGASVPARRPSAARVAAIAAALAAAGHRVVLTGSAAEFRFAAEARQAPGTPPAAGNRTGRRAGLVNLCGRTDLPMLAAVLAGADAVVVPNTGAAHLAAAVGTPVVSLFAPVVPAARWAPYGVPAVLLGDQDAPCAGSRARVCPVPGHPCLDLIDPAAVVAAVATLTPGETRPARNRPTEEVPTRTVTAGTAPAELTVAVPGAAGAGAGG